MPSRIAPTLLRLASAAFVAVLALSAYHRTGMLSNGHQLVEFLKFYAAPLVVVAILLFWLAGTSLVPPVLSVIMLGSVLVALYMAEVYIAWYLVDEKGKIAEAAERLGTKPDFRSVWEVTQDLRHSGVNAQPFFRPLSNPDLMPLGNSPHRMIVYCNEVGQRMVFEADRHGFNNPDSVWNNPANSIAIIGDSYVHGACSPDNTGFVAQLRRDGADVLNLGIGGNDPQMNLATLIEYAVPRHAKFVIWVHYAGNDLSGMMTWRNNKMLERYVDEPGFSQHLIDRAPEVERLMDRLFVERITPEFSTQPPFSFWHELMSRQGLIKAAKLETLRMVFGLTRNVSEEVDFDLYEKIMQRARMVTEQSGGHLLVLILPAAGQLRPYADSYERETENRLRAAGVDFINLRPLMLEAGDPLGLFSWRIRGGHLSPRGNAWLAKLIEKQVLANRK